MKEIRKEQIFKEVCSLCDNYNNKELEYIIESIKWLLEERERQEKELKELYDNN